MASIFKDAAQQEMLDQPWHLRYKGSLLIVASGVVWVLTELGQSADMINAGWAPTLGVIATLAAFLLNRFTRDGITPSMVRRLEHAGMKAHLDRPSVSAAVMGTRALPENDVALPVYEGDSTADDEYVGEHRAGE